MKRVVCPNCTRDVGLNRSRLARHHDLNFELCPGSGTAAWATAHATRHAQPTPPVEASALHQVLEMVQTSPMFTTGDQRVQLDDWWRTLPDQELPDLMKKVTDYSAYDLELIGRVLADTLGQPNLEPGIYQELGCWFYLLGKIARAMGAIREGRTPSYDTALDTRIYATMIMRIKTAGGWPG